MVRRFILTMDDGSTATIEAKSLEAAQYIRSYNGKRVVSVHEEAQAAQ